MTIKHFFRAAALKSSVAIALFTGFSLSSTICDAQLRIKDLQDLSTHYAEWGVKAGSNFQLLGGAPFQQDYSKGFLAGAYIHKHYGNIALQLEATVSSANFMTTQAVAHKFSIKETVTITDTVSKGDFSALYINVPLIVKIIPKRHFSFLFGLQYTHMLSLTDNNGVFTKKFGTGDVLKTDNVFALTGIEIDITQKLRFGATYSLGFMDMNNQKYVPLTDNWMVGNGQVFLTYRISKFGIRI